MIILEYIAIDGVKGIEFESITEIQRTLNFNSGTSIVHITSIDGIDVSNMMIDDIHIYLKLME